MSLRLEALSYTWGPASPPFFIEANGCHLEIRENLWHCLNQLSEEADTGTDHTPLIFIDQLCIDQENNDERSHQVHNMAKIYRTAEEVILWLGEGSKLGEEGFQVLNGTESHQKYDLAPFWNHLESQRYWTRVWVVQEIVLARKVFLWWGTEKVNLDVLQSQFPYLDDLLDWSQSKSDRIDIREDKQKPLFNQKQNPCPFITSLLRARNNCEGGYTLNCQTVTALLRGRHCEDPRDKVYGLLGVTKYSSRWPDPDYSKSTVEVFEDFLRFASVRACTTEKMYRSVAEVWREELGLGVEVEIPQQIWDERYTASWPSCICHPALVEGKRRGGR